MNEPQKKSAGEWSNKKALYRRGIFLADQLRPAAFAILRIALGVMFAQSGWGKLSNLERTVSYFQSLGIPAANFQAVLVANVEFVGGLFLIVGLFARLWALPLASTMVVAILTALLPEIDGPLQLLTLDEFFYLGILLVVVTTGPGGWSLDRFAERALFGEKAHSSDGSDAQKIESDGSSPVPS